MRRTKEQAAETGRQILHAAESLFLDRGYDNVSLEEIAAAANVTRGAVYWHFKSKQGLLLAVRDEAQTPFRDLANRLAEENGTALLEELADAISSILERLQSDPRQKGLIRVLFRLDLTLASDNAGSAFQEDISATFRRIFEAVDRDVGLPSPWLPETSGDPC